MGCRTKNYINRGLMMCLSVCVCVCVCVCVYTCVCVSEREKDKESISHSVPPNTLSKFPPSFLLHGVACIHNTWCTRTHANTHAQVVNVMN